MTKRILFLSPFFFPEQISTGKYNSFLVQKLVDSGFEVDVVSFHPFYPEWEITPSDDGLTGVEIFRYGSKVLFPRSQIFRRIILELSYFFTVFRHLASRKKSYDISISVFPPVLFMFVEALFNRSAVRIGIVHDVQGIMATAEKSKARLIAAFVMGKLEKFAYRKCHRLICLSHSMKQAIVEKFSINETVCEVVYPFVSFQAEEGGEKEDRLEDLFDSEFQHIVYSGALGEKQRPRELYRFMQLLADQVANVTCHIFSRGPAFDELVNSAAQSGDNRVLFHDLVDESDISSLFVHSSVQIIPQASGTGDGAFPSKLPNLLAHGVPVFAICDLGSELDQVLSRAKYAKAVHDWNDKDMLDEMVAFLGEIRNVSHEEQYSVNKETILKEFDVSNFIKTLS